MNLLQELIANRELHVISEEDSVLEATKTFTKKNVGAVARCSRASGWWESSRSGDVARRVVLEGLDPASTKVAEVMTTGHSSSASSPTVSTSVSRKCEARKSRHLPVIDEKRLVGFISMRDLFKHEIQIQAEELKHLNDYIHFVPPTADQARS